MKWRVPVRWEFDEAVVVHADSPEEALAAAANVARDAIVELAENGEINASDIEVFDIE